jgi:membrane protein implicated in regulation of membrane protease activity
MNRAYLIVGIPAVITSFCWLAFGWGWRLAVSVTATEIVAITAFVIYILRRQNRRASGTESGR